MSALIEIASNKNTSNNNQNIVTGIDDTYPMYMVSLRSGAVGYNNGIGLQVTKSGVAHTSNVYEYFGHNTNSANTSLYSSYATTHNFMRWVNNVNASNAYNHGEMSYEIYLYNFANASGYDYIFIKGVGESNDQKCWGLPSFSGVVKTASASDGIRLINNQGNAVQGVLTLYGLKG